VQTRLGRPRRALLWHWHGRGCAERGRAQCGMATVPIIKGAEQAPAGLLQRSPLTAMRCSAPELRRPPLPSRARSAAGACGGGAGASAAPSSRSMPAPSARGLEQGAQRRAWLESRRPASSAAPNASNAHAGKAGGLRGGREGDAARPLPVPHTLPLFEGTLTLPYGRQLAGQPPSSTSSRLRKASSPPNSSSGSSAAAAPRAPASRFLPPPGPRPLAAALGVPAAGALRSAPNGGTAARHPQLQR